MYKIAIIGLGPAGIFVLAHLPHDLKKNTVVFEPSAIGGALLTTWGAVVANLPKSKLVEALRAVPAWSDKQLAYLDKYADDECPLLYDAARQLNALIAPDVGRTHFHSACVIEYRRSAAGAHFEIKSEHNKLFEVQKIVLCTGAAPKTIDLPKPTIPLHIALNPALLQNIVSPHDRIVVFGTAHSGTLVLRNLKNAGVKTLTAIYKGSTPFMYARDGYSEGIKQESATIADDLLAARWADLVSLDDFGAAHRAVTEASAVVYAIGFERPSPVFTDINGTVRPLYGEQNVYGFGIGFPAPYTGPDAKSYPDVGFGGFISAIKAALPSLLTFDS